MYEHSAIIHRMTTIDHVLMQYSRIPFTCPIKVI